MLKTMQQLEVEHAAQMAELARKHDVAASLPQGLPEPDYIYLFGKDRPSVKYRVNQIEQTLPIIEAYGDLETISARESGCLSIHPIDEHPKSYADGKERWETPNAVEMRQHGGRGFYSVSIVFWPQSPKVRVEIEVKHIHHTLRVIMRASYNNHGEVTKVELTEPDAMRGMYLNRVKFNVGSADAFDIRYFFDHPESLRNVVAAVHTCVRDNQDRCHICGETVTP